MYKNHQNVNRSTIYMNIQNRFRKLNILHHWYEWYASCIKVFLHTLHKVIYMNGNVHKMICFLYTNTLTNLYAKNGMHCYKALSKITTSWNIKVITTSWNMKLYGKIERLKVHEKETLFFLFLYKAIHQWFHKIPIE